MIKSIEIMCKTLKYSGYPSHSHIKKDIVPMELCLFLHHNSLRHNEVHQSHERG